jgi:hypothetical protein
MIVEEVVEVDRMVAVVEQVRLWQVETTVLAVQVVALGQVAEQVVLAEQLLMVMVQMVIFPLQLSLRIHIIFLIRLNLVL